MFNKDGAAGAVSALKAAGHPPGHAPAPPVREVLATHAATLGAHASQLADHGNRLDKLDGGPENNPDGPSAQDADAAGPADEPIPSPSADDEMDGGASGDGD